jgi:hypothetical protein
MVEVDYCNLSRYVSRAALAAGLAIHAQQRNSMQGFVTCATATRLTRPQHQNVHVTVENPTSCGTAR